MQKFTFSLHTILSLIIGFMGLLSLTFALVSGTIHQNHAYENQRISMRELIRIKSTDLLEELADIEHKLGIALLTESSFRRAYKDKNIPQLNKLLYNEFNRYYVSTEQIKLEKLTILSLDFNIIAERASEASLLKSGEAGCPNFIEQVKQRKGAHRLKIKSALCTYNKHPYHTMILPIGGLRITGYIIITSDPVHNLIPTETALGMPVTIKTYDKNIPYQSRSLLNKTNSVDTITAEYILHTNNNVPAISISITDKVRPLIKSLPNLRVAVMLSATFITLFFIVLAAVILRRTTIGPLEKLANQLQLVHLDRINLGNPVEINGTTEISDLGRNFNIMTAELDELYCSLEHMAYTDQLTELPNRNKFQKHFQSVLENHQKSDQPFALFLMDIDRFKTINDTLGHNIGDQVIIDVATRLRNILHSPGITEHIDKEEIVARLGGDEFAAIISTGDNISTLEKNASAVAQKIITTMERPFNIDDQNLIIGISIGIVLFPVHGKNINDLMRKAEVAMYHAKNIRYGFGFYSDAHDNYSIRYLNLSQDLHNAINTNQLELYYQPKINITSGTICGAEALIRWNHPELGLVQPDDFVYIAEQTGLIRIMTRWIINKAIAQCALWHLSGHDICVSINLSASNFHDHDLLKEIDASIAEHSLSSNKLVLEITESTVMTDLEYTLGVIDKLKERSIKISIDDFGTEYSSLAYIKQLPIDEIKIDKSFIKNICTDKNDEAIIRSILVLSHYMQMEVVAEGVEDIDSYTKLQDLGCDIAQGYYISKPMPFADFMKWLQVSEYNQNKRDAG